MVRALIHFFLIIFLFLIAHVSPVFSADSKFLNSGNTAGSEIIMQCFNNSGCSEGFFCEKPVGNCNGPGVCIQKPDACVTLYMPVCGCDGLTYGNSCEAAMSGVSVACVGECGKCYTCCDINKDGVCDISDVILLLRCALKIDHIEVCQDINADGNYDISDVILTLRMALKLDPLKPCT